MLVNFDCSLLWFVDRLKIKIKILYSFIFILQLRVKDRFKLTQALVVDPLYLQHSYSDKAIDYRVGYGQVFNQFMILLIFLILALGYTFEQKI